MVDIDAQRIAAAWMKVTGHRMEFIWRRVDLVINRMVDIANELSEGISLQKARGVEANI